MPAPASPNFGFLAVHDNQLVQAAADAERLFAEHPHASLMMLRLFGELLAQRVAASAGLYANYEENQANLLGRLKARGVISRDVGDMFHTLRKVGNAASHQLQGDHRQALQLLRMARELGVWFHRAFGGTPGFHPGAFVPPPDPRGETQALAAQLKELREALSQAQGAQEAARTLAEHEAHLRSEAETKAAKADEERAQWEELALLTDAEKAKTAAELRALQAERTQAPAQAQAFVEQAAEAGERVVLDEHQTRLLIDQQLRDAGWDADTEVLTFNGGARPELGKAKAIAEWPTDSGPADYALFLGLVCVGVVEAKRQNIDAAGAIGQAKRYARGMRNVELPEGSPYRDFRVPFLFSSNGRGYLRQLKDKSGVHFLDVRRPQNHPEPLEGWYTPGGLKDVLAQDVDAADQRLRQEQTDYLNLRDYQVKAIKAVEQGLEAGRREMLVAMATGTGKTKMCIGLLYRLLKTKRVRRVLFLVDRSSLGSQSKDAFVEMRLENLQTFADIFEVKGLQDLKPEKETKVHIATIQAMVKRILFTDEGVPPVDAYDCIIVDECHRGYLLDRELDDDELNFRDEADYISKYRRVLDHFDAVKIGLTATPALHTVDIFGKPVFTYSYREAVIDGFLVDHDPPLQITTELAEDGMTWKAGEEMAVIDRETGDVDTVTLPDDVQLEIESYNRRVITESFNRVVCERIAHHIDPQLFEKTIVFCVTDAHADLVVRLLKEAFDRQYGGVDDDLVCKITGKSDRPEQLIRLFKNERAPSVAVTVDLLTTGIDVPAVANIVFLRRIRSRILYDQMLGRATRLCPEIGKSTFRVFDAVDLYGALAPLTDMKPVVVNPKISFEELIADILRAPEPSLRERLVDQLLAKLRAKERRMSDDARGRFQELTGLDPQAFADQLRREGAGTAAETLASLPHLPNLLDRKYSQNNPWILSLHDDKIRREAWGYGSSSKPEDYLDAFASYLRQNMNQIPALVAVTQRPRDLTRAQLKELRLLLDEQGYRESYLQTAWREKSNADIAASIIGFIRQAALGDALVPYPERVDRALRTLLASRAWTPGQRKWLQRIGAQMKVEVIVDRTNIDEGEFKAQAGGFDKLNKQFEGGLEGILGDLRELVWAGAEKA